MRSGGGATPVTNGHVLGQSSLPGLCDPSGLLASERNYTEVSVLRHWCGNSESSDVTCLMPHLCPIGLRSYLPESRQLGHD